MSDARVVDPQEILMPESLTRRKCAANNRFRWPDLGMLAGFPTPSRAYYLSGLTLGLGRTMTPP
jgi:hypothetical protein